MHRNLRGEWPCVPFGYPVDRKSFPHEWQDALPVDDQLEDVHGYSSNHEWRFINPPGSVEVAMEIDYPSTHPVRRLERRLRPLEGAAIELDLTIEVQRDCSLPVALHWSFALPNRPGTAKLRPGAFDAGATYPGSLSPGAELFEPAAGFSDLRAVPNRTGSPLDATLLPFEKDIQELLQLNGNVGHFSLQNLADGYRVDLRWPVEILPSVLLWHSNGTAKPRRGMVETFVLGSNRVDQHSECRRPRATCPTRSTAPVFRPALI